MSANTRSRLVAGLFTALLATLSWAGCAAPGDGDISNDRGGGEVTESAQSAPPTTEAMSERGPFGAGVRTVELVDPSRETPAYGDFEGSDSRQLTTEIWYPSAKEAEQTSKGKRDVDLAPGSDPFPVILYAHGFFGSRKDNPTLAAFLASHGYLVLAPDFPATNRSAPGEANPRDVPEQPADLRFVLNAALAADSEDFSFLKGRLDGNTLGVVGLSMGGLTALLSAFDPDRSDVRVDAVVTLAAATCMVPTAFFSKSVPLLIIHGNRDAIVDYASNAQPLYETAMPPKCMVTLLGGSHTGFADATASLLDQIPDPDSLGCSALASSEVTQVQPNSFMDLEQAVLAPECPIPCAGEDSGEGIMRPTRQIELTLPAVRAFFDHQLRGDASARLYLSLGLGAEHDDVDVECNFEETP